MRDDAVGLFWDERPQPRVAGQRVLGPMPTIPDTGWLPPRAFPNLSAARVLSLDTETYDPDLLTHGPGWARNNGHIVGVSIGADDDGKWYFPMRHTIEPELNLAPDVVLAWLRDALSNPKQPKVGANLTYDIGWLEDEGVLVAGDLFDVQLAEALLTERGDVNLDHLGKKYLGQGKQTNLLYRWLADWYGGDANGKQRKNIWRATPRLVGPYAEDDAALPLQIAKKQWPEVARQGLTDVLTMENGLIRLIVKMRQAGVTVDVARAEELRERLVNMQRATQEKLDALIGFPVNTNSAEDLARAFDSVNVDYTRTTPTESSPEGRPSFTKAWLKQCGHPIANMTNEIRRVSKLRSTFLESYILDSHVNGVVHGQFHLLRGDAEGTRSGRLSSSTPNLQNIPSRDKELAPLIRGMFVPDAGHKQWRRYDYSQIEYRFLVHYATGPGADDARQRYRDAPDTDYHEFVIDMIAQLTGIALGRKAAKNINFGLIYGMGIPKLLHTLGLDKREGKKLFDAYHSALPYVKVTMDAAIEEAQHTGIITTIMGRRSRFELWEPDAWTDCANRAPLPYELALRRYGSVKRAAAHKGLNRRLQGSAADLMKRAMFECWQQGIFDATGVPRVTVHDELGFSDPGGKDDAFVEARQILENALPLRVPVRCACEVGPDWGHVA